MRLRHRADLKQLTQAITGGCKVACRSEAPEHVPRTLGGVSSFFASLTLLKWEGLTSPWEP